MRGTELGTGVEVPWVRDVICWWPSGLCGDR